jgi:HK97 family phage portal protein
MSIRQRIGMWAARMAVKAAGGPPRDPGMYEFLFGNRASSSGVEVNENTAYNSSAIWAAVSMIAGSLASLPVCLYERTKRGKEEVTDGRLVSIVRDEPNPEMTPAVYKETTQAHILTWGNGLAEIERDKGGNPLNLWPLAPHLVKPGRTKAGELVYVVRDQASGQESALPATNVLHIPGLGCDGLWGYSVIQKARESIGLTLAAERFGASLFGNGATPGGVLSTDQKMSQEAVMNLRGSWSAEHGGLTNAHRLAILHSGLKYQTIAHTPEDAQFLETRKFQLEEIARWFNLPPHLIRHLDRATFSNIEHQGQEYVKYTLGIWMCKWEQELNRKFLRPEQRSRFFYEFDADRFLRGDMKSRYEAYNVGRQGGFLSVNDIRARENLNPLGEEGDVYLIPQNYANAKSLGETNVQGSPNGGEAGAAK